MTRFFGKLAFVHRWLWTRNGRYRYAVLFGPAPLVGALVAAGVWASVSAWQELTYRAPPWAKLNRDYLWNTSSAQPQVVPPSAPMPPVDADGLPIGYASGWRVAAHPIELLPTEDVDVKPTALMTSTIDGPSIDMTQVLARGPKSTLFVDVGSGLLVVRKPGVYGFTARFERSAGLHVNCLMRLSLGPRRIVSTYMIDVVRDTSRQFDPARFEFQPGLYPVSWAFGCWRDHDIAGPGRLTMLLAGPDEAVPRPLRSNEVVRPAERAP